MDLVRSGLRMLVAAAVSGALAPSADAQKRNRDVITRQEILNSAHQDRDLYEAVRSLRPHFLAGPRGVRTLGGAPPAPTVLYVNGTKMGDLEGLKLIRAVETEEVRYLEPSRAENEFGIGHSGGAVLVKLVKPTKAEKPDTTDRSFKGRDDRRVGGRC
jgi:hypothetical protein